MMELGTAVTLAKKAAGSSVGPLFRALVERLVIRRETRRFSDQLVGTYFTFHKTVANEQNEVTVNVLHVYPRLVVGRIQAEWYNGVSFRNGMIEAEYSYRGNITLGQSEYWLNLHGINITENSFISIPICNDSIQLCPAVFVAMNYNHQPYAHLGLVVSQRYFVKHLINIGSKSFLMEALNFAAEPKPDAAPDHCFLGAFCTQRDLLVHFEQMKGYVYGTKIGEGIGRDPGFIKYPKYNRDIIPDFGSTLV